MLEGEYIKNNTRFCKPPRKVENSLFLRNVIFVYSDTIALDMQNLFLEEGINTIRLTSSNYKLNNLDFLNDYDLPFIRSIDILSDSVTNIEGIYSLKNLERIDSNNQKIDYSRFPKLRSLGGELSTFSYKTLGRLTALESIGITNKFREDDVSIFSNNTNLKSLMLRGSKIASLKGLENFKELERLELFYNRRLESLEGITEKHKKLKEIAIYNAPKLFYVNEYLAPLTWIEYLQLEAKKVDSFKFLDKLTNLNILGIHNKLNDAEDNDKSPLIDALKRTNGEIW